MMIHIGLDIASAILGMCSEDKAKAIIDVIAEKLPRDWSV